MEEASIFVHVAINDITGKVTFYKIYFLFCINVATEFLTVVEEKFTSKIKISWSFTHPHVIQDVRVFLQSQRNLGFWGKHSKMFLHIVDFNGLKVQIAVSMQLQRALHNPIFGIRVLSSEMIGHFLKFKCIYFLMYILH